MGNKGIFGDPVKLYPAAGRFGQEETPQDPVVGIEGEPANGQVVHEQLPAHRAAIAEGGAGRHEDGDLVSTRRQVQMKNRPGSGGPMHHAETSVHGALIPAVSAQNLVIDAHDKGA